MSEADIARMQALKPGDPVTNICAGDENPHRHATFICCEIVRCENKYGIAMTSHFAQCSDGKRTWRTGIEVIYPGHLDMPTCEALFAQGNDMGHAPPRNIAASAWRLFSRPGSTRPPARHHFSNWSAAPW